MNIFLISIMIFIIIYPFTVYFKLKSLSKGLAFHGDNIEKLVKIYEIEKSEKNLKNLDRERRTYNSLVRANDHKLDSTLGKFIANKYSFEKKEHFDFKA